MTTFANLNLDPQITKALEICGYTKPTPIQAQSIPEILMGKDMVASAQTGTGKTAAFVLPALHRLASDQKKNVTRVLILTPTRELATQITNGVSKYGKFLRCNIASLVGGMPYRQQLRSLSRPVDIIVATPGRLMDHMSNGRLDLSGVEMLVLDEADRMLDMGFVDDVKNIASAMPKNRQTLLFSATVDDRLTQIIRQLLKDPVRIDIATEKLAPTKITQELYVADNPQHKMQLLSHFVNEQNIFKAIIFSSTKANADRLADELYEQGFAAAALHGDLKQSMRTRTLEQLRSGRIQFLVATDVAARGIDIQDITHVINFDLPKFSEDYVHRIGRTGRAGREGVAISFALPSDARHVKNIERLLRQTLEQKVVIGLEPKKQLSGGHSTGGKPNSKKKRYSDDRFSGHKSKKDFAREGFAARKSLPVKKKFADRDSGGFKPRGERSDAPHRDRKEFGGNEGFAAHKPKAKKEFGGRDSGSFAPRSERSGAPRRDRKEFGGSEGFGERKPRAKKEFGGRDGSGFAPRSERSGAPRRDRKQFDGNSEGFGARKPRAKKEFGGRDSGGFAPRSERSGAPRRDRKEFGGSSEGFGARKPKAKKEFGGRDSDGFAPRSERSGAPRRDRKEFGNGEGFAVRKPKTKREFGSRDGGNFAPRSERSGAPRRDRKEFAGKEGFAGRKSTGGFKKKHVKK